MSNTYKVVGVRFSSIGKTYYFDPGELNVSKGDGVIVETSRGKEYGTAVTEMKVVGEKEINQPLKPIERLANEKDQERIEDIRRSETEAVKVCNEKVKKHQLPMKLIKAEYTFDKSKIVFYFTSESRVDFRDLVKELASIFRTRIELRQVGVRDEAKHICGYGSCGRTLCCCSFLGDFETVSIKMAKNQGISLNPAKISGVCGRLMCCLKYEDEAYAHLRSDFPKEGSFVETPGGRGKVTKNSLFDRQVTVLLVEGGFGKFPLEEVEWKNVRPETPEEAERKRRPREEKPEGKEKPRRDRNRKRKPQEEQGTQGQSSSDEPKEEQPHEDRPAD